ncbi:MAG TPA: RodZ domain-containing protein [Rudaea sp.]|nr:RodZ domain-containing protein [Rudaea sp.]
MNNDPTNIDHIEAAPACLSETADNAAAIAQPGESCEVSDSLGLRLREARMARGLSVETVAQQLKLPHTVIEALEAEHFDRIGQGIFLRGYLVKLLKLLDLPQVLAAGVLEPNDALPPLVTSGAVSRTRYLFDRYSGSVLPLILTGVIIVPAVLLAMHVGLDDRTPRITPLDAPLADTQTIAPQGDGVTNPVPGTSATPVKPEPGSSTSNAPAVMASMATFISATPQTLTAEMPAPPASVQAPDVPVAEAGTHNLHLQLVEPSWVEVVDGSGKQLEYALLPAGTARDYRSTHSLSVLLGNAAGASIRVDGKPRELTPYLRGNVARFKLADGDWTDSSRGG